MRWNNQGKLGSKRHVESSYHTIGGFGQFSFGHPGGNSLVTADLNVDSYISSSSFSMVQQYWNSWRWVILLLSLSGLLNNVSVALEESAKVRGNYLNDVIGVILIMARDFLQQKATATKWCEFKRWLCECLSQKKSRKNPGFLIHFRDWNSRFFSICFYDFDYCFSVGFQVSRLDGSAMLHR